MRTTTRAVRFFSSSSAAIATSQRWVEEWIIGQKLCPFAKPVNDSENLRYVSSRSTTLEELYEEADAEIQMLKTRIQQESSGEGVDMQLPESTLLVLPCSNSCNDEVTSLKDDFHNFHRQSWEIQVIHVPPQIIAVPKSFS